MFDFLSFFFFNISNGVFSSVSDFLQGVTMLSFLKGDYRAPDFSSPTRILDSGLGNETRTEKSDNFLVTLDLGNYQCSSNHYRLT